jgi:hypothetical protein
MNDLEKAHLGDLMRKGETHCSHRRWVDVAGYP